MEGLNKLLDDLNLKGAKGKLVAILAVATSSFFLYTSCMGSFTPFVQRGVLLALTMPLVFLLISSGKKGLPFKFIDLLFTVAAPIPFIYIILIQDSLM
ncbi:MAG TPA: hypothetical protein VFD15_04640, partial [Clostridia bacterium]|nr:hypothetical protein [Clostridia bacterium]